MKVFRIILKIGILRLTFHRKSEYRILRLTCEHFRKMKKPKKFDTFLYRNFKCSGHSHNKIVIQPVKKSYVIQIHKLD